MSRLYDKVKAKVERDLGFEVELLLEREEDWMYQVYIRPMFRGAGKDDWTVDELMKVAEVLRGWCVNDSVDDVIGVEAERWMLGDGDDGGAAGWRMGAGAFGGGRVWLRRVVVGEGGIWEIA